MNGLKPISEQGSQTIFLGIKHGRITRKNIETAEEELYQSVTGVLTRLSERNADFNGSTITFIELYLVNGDERYKLSVNRDSGAARSIINALASAKDFTKPVVIRPWEGDPDESGRRFTNVSVYVGEAAKENKLPWAVELPKVKHTQVGRNLVVDDTDRFNAVQKLMEDIRAKLGTTEDLPEGGLGPITGDLPEGNAGW